MKAIGNSKKALARQSCWFLMVWPANTRQFSGLTWQGLCALPDTIATNFSLTPEWILARNICTKPLQIVSHFQEAWQCWEIPVCHPAVRLSWPAQPGSDPTSSGRHHRHNVRAVSWENCSLSTEGHSGYFGAVQCPDLGSRSGGYQKHSQVN